MIYMVASKDNPIYTVSLVSNGVKYNVSNCVEKLDFSDQEEKFSKSVKIELANIKTRDGKWLCNLAKPRDRVFIFANDGERNEEVWRGFIWAHGYKSSTSTRLIVWQAYDNLIYAQESEESEFFAEGKNTKDVVGHICSKWGIKYSYEYSTITHPKMVLRGNLANILTADILDKVKERTGKKYVIYSEYDVMNIKGVGTNEKVYKILAGKNAITTEAEQTMDGVKTKVVILGKADKSEKLPVEAVVSGKTDTYGTIQKIINRNENTTLADSKKEAQNFIDEYGEPKWEYKIEAPDIPWIRKGEKVYVSAGNLIGYFIVKGIQREISLSKKIMTLTLEAFSSSASSSSASSSSANTGSKTVEEIAKEVIQGKWGNGNDRKNKLEAAGYNYSEVQAMVNKLMRG